jgi:hypothetical protein
MAAASEAGTFPAFFSAQRFVTACLAISDLRSGVNAAALANPPICLLAVFMWLVYPFRVRAAILAGVKKGTRRFLDLLTLTLACSAFGTNQSL